MFINLKSKRKVFDTRLTYYSIEMFILRQLILGTLLLYLHHTNSVYDNEKTYFIKATEDSPCAAQPCLTLSKFVSNITEDFKASVILQFGAGNHTHNSRWNFSNIEKCSMSSKDNNSTIICNEVGAGFTFNNVSIVTMANLTFIGCGNSSKFYAVLQLFQVSINISVCTFLHSKGRAIEAAHTNVTTQNCTFGKSTAGVVIAENNTAMYDTGSIYSRNTLSSALIFLSLSTANYTNSTFHENFAKPNMISVKSGKLAIMNCELAYNSGITLLISINSTIKIFTSKLTHNFASFLIQILRATNISLSDSTLSHNVAEVRITILYVRESAVESRHTLTIVNNYIISEL
jgi:hypothetical protein